MVRRLPYVISSMTKNSKLPCQNAAAAVANGAERGTGCPHTGSIQ